jgi:hypothetical protein
MIRLINSLDKRNNGPSTTGNKVTLKRADMNSCNQNKITRTRNNYLISRSPLVPTRGKEFAQSEGMVTGATRLDGVNGRDRSPSSCRHDDSFPPIAAFALHGFTHS